MTIKERAARLRAKGEAALRAHLDAQVGARLRVLTETPQLGRSEQFTPVRVASQGAGAIVDVTVAGHDGRHLIAA